MLGLESSAQTLLITCAKACIGPESSALKLKPVRHHIQARRVTAVNFPIAVRTAVVLTESYCQMSLLLYSHPQPSLRCSYSSYLSSCHDRHRNSFTGLKPDSIFSWYLIVSVAVEIHTAYITTSAQCYDCHFWQCPFKPISRHILPTKKATKSCR